MAPCVIVLAVKPDDLCLIFNYNLWSWSRQKYYEYKTSPSTYQGHVLSMYSSPSPQRLHPSLSLPVRILYSWLLSHFRKMRALCKVLLYRVLRKTCQMSFYRWCVSPSPVKYLVRHTVLNATSPRKVQCWLGNQASLRQHFWPPGFNSAHLIGTRDSQHPW